MLIEQLINLEKVRTDNLKFGTDLQDRAMDGWSVLHIIITVDECLHRKIAQTQKIFKSKIEAHPVNSGHYMAFKHSISFATNLAANFGCDRFRIKPDIVSSFCAPPYEVAALFDSNLSRRPFAPPAPFDIWTRRTSRVSGPSAGFRGGREQSALTSNPTASSVSRLGAVRGHSLDSFSLRPLPLPPTSSFPPALPSSTLLSNRGPLSLFLWSKE